MPVTSLSASEQAANPLGVMHLRSATSAWRYPSAMNSRSSVVERAQRLGAEQPRASSDPTAPTAVPAGSSAGTCAMTPKWARPSTTPSAKARVAPKVGRWTNRLVQLRLGVLDDDAAHARQEEHAAVVRRVAGHQDFRKRQRDSARTATRARAPCRCWPAGRRDPASWSKRARLRARMAASFARRSSSASVEACGRYQLDLYGCRNSAGCRVTPGNAARTSSMRARSQPSRKRSSKLSSGAACATIEQLRSDAADDEVGRRQRLRSQKPLDVAHQPPRAVAEERATAPGRAPPRRILEAARGLRVAEQRAVEIAGEGV